MLRYAPFCVCVCVFGLFMYFSLPFFLISLCCLLGDQWANKRTVFCYTCIVMYSSNNRSSNSMRTIHAQFSFNTNKTKRNDFKAAKLPKKKKENIKIIIFFPSICLLMPFESPYLSVLPFTHSLTPHKQRTNTCAEIYYYNR